MIKLVRILNLTNFFMPEINNNIENTDNNQESIENQSLDDNQRESLESSLKFISGEEKILRTLLLKNWDPKDKEYWEVANSIKSKQDKIQWYKSELGQLKNDITEKVKHQENISNDELLWLSQNERLWHITKNSVEAEQLLNGSVDNIEFTFTFDWVFNKELYLATTAWQVLPKEVRLVSVWNDQFQRTWLNGEFYNVETNSRLIIREWTDLHVDKIWTEEELNALTKTSSEFIKNNVEYWEFSEKIDFILNKWIKEEYIKILWLEKLWSISKIDLEKFTTDIWRELNFLNILESKGKLPKNYEEFEKVIEISKSLRTDFIDKANLTDNEKVQLIKATEKMSITQIANYIEQIDNKAWRTGIDYESVLDVYTWNIEKDAWLLTWRVRLREVVPNVNIELNETYDKYNIDAVPENKREDVLKVIAAMPEWWDAIVCRNAIKNPDFSANKPFIAQNLTYKTAAIYYPWDEKVTIIPVNHWSWIWWIGAVSNVSWSHWTSLWSKELIAQWWGKYQFRLVVKWLEPLVAKFRFDRGEAMEHDPAEFGNSNDEARVIRIHETSTWNKNTRGCTGMSSWDAQKLYSAIKNAWWWAQETFVSTV